jgi:hypothetical protein
MELPHRSSIGNVQASSHFLVGWVPKVRDFARSLVARHNALEERAGFVELRFPWAG